MKVIQFGVEIKHPRLAKGSVEKKSTESRVEFIEITKSYSAGEKVIKDCFEKFAIYYKIKMAFESSALVL